MQIKLKINNLHISFCLLFFLFCSIHISAQNSEIEYNSPDNAQFETPSTLLWLGTYSTLRLSENLFWVAQHHYRRINYEGVPFVGRMTQIYNRHALTYKFSDDFLFTLGPVLRLNFTPEPGNDNYRRITLEPRIWHQYVFPVRGFLGDRQVIIQHRIRIEHRWSKSNLIGAGDWVYRDRFRYRFTMKIPITRKTLQPNTLYAMPLNIEPIIQRGSTIVDAPLEDFRIYPSIGYIASTKLSFSLGIMYTTGQNIGQAYNYGQRWVLRPNIIWTPDLRKFEERVPEIGIMD